MTTTLERAWREDRDRHHYHPVHRRKTPSFSSSLLDAIYRSIDDTDDNGQQQEQLFLCRETIAVRTKPSNVGSSDRFTVIEDDKDAKSLRRAIVIEQWEENQSNSSRDSRRINSNSSSSDSSCGGMFSSSSETESAYKSNPKPRSRICASDIAAHFEQETPKREGRFTKTKSRALKMYGDLKRVKQPISPGGRIASFLNSIFNSKTLKKPSPNQNSTDDWNSVRKSRSVEDSAATCSSASSFSRSCLSKTPCKAKRSVRFFPVSVIVDEECRPCGHKSIYEDDPSIMPTPIIRKFADTAILKKTQTSAKNKVPPDSLRRYHRDKSTNPFASREFYNYRDEHEDDDVDSCSSSDLFELENIGTIGMAAYGEELPVYGTTSLEKNPPLFPA